jgi:hypothetical protein
VASTAAALADARGPDAGGATALALARRNHVTALTAYESALRAMRLPVPRRLRDDLRLLSGVVSLTERGPVAYAQRVTRERHG